MPHPIVSSLFPFHLRHSLASTVASTRSSSATSSSTIPSTSTERRSVVVDAEVSILSPLVVSEYTTPPMQSLTPGSSPHLLHSHQVTPRRELQIAGSSPARAPRGAYVLQQWVPFDIWPRIAGHLTATVDKVAFQCVCIAAYAAVQSLQAARLRLVCHTFRAVTFALPPDIVGKILMVHVVPPRADSLILFLDESDAGRGVEIAWLRAGRIRRAPLGLDGVPASSASNIIFSPDSSRIACLVTLAHSALTPDQGDPLHRLRGWERVSRTRGQVVDIVYDPCEDCTVQVIDLITAPDGFPDRVSVHTFSHVFVPEYGFDMVWRPDPDGGLELAFAAMLHSAAGAATYLVRWRGFPFASERVISDGIDVPRSVPIESTRRNFVFMACIDGASVELLHDKRKAMLTLESTTCTSRIELSQDANIVFFDTLSKFGILCFDQVVDASKSRVTRADLPNNPFLFASSLSPSLSPSSSSSSPSSSQTVKYSDTEVLEHSMRRALRQLNVGNPRESRKRITGRQLLHESVRVSRMSPDGSLLGSIVCIGDPTSPSNATHHARHVEMRSSATGRLVYRRSIIQSWRDRETGASRKLPPRCFSVPLDKSANVAQHALSFSTDSTLLVLWDAFASRSHIIFSHRLPLVLDAQTGRLIQDFSRLSRSVDYEFLQMAPDALTVYGTRMFADQIVMDAVDVLSGSVVKTVTVTGPVQPPKEFSPHANFLLDGNILHTVSRGEVDVLWLTTRGSLGCGWSGRRRFDEHEMYGDVPEDESIAETEDVP